jgi:hypothetical protein
MKISKSTIHVNLTIDIKQTLTHYGKGVVNQNKT